MAGFNKVTRRIAPHILFGAAGLALAAAAGIASAVPAAAQAPHYRADPLRPWWDTQPRRPSVLMVVSPVRVAATSGAVQSIHADTMEPAKQPRMVGLISGRGVYALVIDAAGVSRIVKPGQILENGARVLSIGPDGVVLSPRKDLVP